MVQHQLIGLTLFIAVVAQTLSIQYRRWLAPYVVYLGSLIWQFCWWITIGICFFFEELPFGTESVIFGFEGLLIYFVGLVLASKLHKISISAQDGCLVESDDGNKETCKGHDEKAALVTACDPPNAVV